LAPFRIGVSVGTVAFPAGPLRTDKVTVIESPLLPRNDCVNVAVNAVPTGVVPVAAEIDNVSDCCTADDGTTERRPKPKAATATSATRLKVVFVDICFLSISQEQEFPALGLGSKPLSHFAN
jgi:hypothetical protein